MEIIVGEYAGFCNGAKNAVNKTNEILNGDSFYSIGEIVHNEEVVKYLKSKGLIVKNDLSEVPDNAKLIIRAHGEGIKFYQEAKKRNIELVDLTCGRVKLVHNKILGRKNSFVIIIGKKTHPEVIAHKSYSDTSYVVNSIDDINDCYQEDLNCGKDKVYVVAQTTFNSELFDEIVNEIRKVFGNIEVDKTICNATSIRQKEAREIASKVDKMIVIGGKNSSNTQELAIEAGKCCKVVYLIQTKDDLNKEMFDKDDVVGITAGASTPDKSISDVIEYLDLLYNKNK
jgi:4-hydroxy-3-methylbut-2-enyl diphosphate reductase